MPDSRIRRLTSWLMDNVVWDRSPNDECLTFSRCIWATRKIVLIVAITTLLTWQEWVKHHPPEIIVVTILHFIVVFTMMAFVVFTLQQIGRLMRSR